MAGYKSGDVIPAGEVEYASGSVVPADQVTLAPPEPERGLLPRLGSAALRGAGAEAAGINKTLALAASTPFMAADAIRGGITGAPDTRAQDWAFEKLVSPAAQTVRDLAPTPAQAASIPESMAYGLGAMAVDLPLIAVTGGKAGVPQAVAAGQRVATVGEMAVTGMKAMAPVAVSHAVGQASSAVEQGVDLPTAYASGAVTGATSTLAGALPMSLRGSLPTRLATGAVSQVATGELDRQAQNKVLADYPALQTELTAQGVATNAAMGALLGGVMGPRPIKATIAAETAAVRAEIDPQAPAAEPLRIGYTNSPNHDPRVQVVYPDGSVAHPGDVETYLKGLPDDQARMDARARLYGIATKEDAAPAPMPIPDLIDPAITARLAKAPVEGETAPFKETIPAKSQQHVEDMAAIRDAGEVPTGVPQQDRARVDALYVGTKVPQDLEGYTPTAMELAMREALQSRESVDAKVASQAAFDQQVLAAAAAKEADLTAIQNITKGRELAEAAARGEVPAAAVELRMPPEHFTDTLRAVVEATNAEAVAADAKPIQKGLVTRIADKVAAAVKDEPTLDGQLAAIEKLRDANRKNAPSLELLGKLYDNLSEGRTKPNETAPAVEAAQTVKAEAPPGAPPEAAARVESTPPAAAKPDVTIAPEAAPVLAVPPPDVVQTPKQIDAARAEPTAAPTAGADAPPTGKITADAVHSVRKDDFYGPHSVVTLSDGNTVRIKLMGETESNGHPGWHDLTADEPSRLSLLGASKQAAVEKLLQRVNPLEAAADDGLRVNPLLSKVRPEVIAKVDAAKAILARMDAEYSALLDARRAGGPEIPAEERARYSAAIELSNAIDSALNPKANPPSNAHLDGLAEWARDYDTPAAYAKAKAEGLFPKLDDGTTLPRMQTFDRPNRGLQELLKSDGSPTKTADILGHIKDNGSAPWTRKLAAELQEANTGTTIAVRTPGFMDAQVGKDAVGAYSPDYNRIAIKAGAESESTVLHEIVHSATHAAVERARSGALPRNQLEAKQQKAVIELEALRTEIKGRMSLTDHYGLTNVHEFLAELHTNPKFQEFLNHKGLWTRMVEAVRKLLGLEVNARTDLEKAMDLSRNFTGKEAYEAVSRSRMEGREFDSSFEGAARVVDDVLPRILKEDAEAKLRAGIARFPQVVAQKLLPAETVQFMANWVRTNPALRAVGFDKGVDGYLKAIEARELAGVYASADSGKFSGKMDAMFRALPEADSKALRMSMSEITTGSSIGGFDPTMNFADNLKARPDLLLANKSYIDGIHRKFTQLEKSNPEAAKAVVEGAQVNRKDYVLSSSAVISNLLNAVTGNAVRLETELARMSKTDADYARMEARVLSARQEANLAVSHAPGLDFMAKDLRAAKNGNAAQHLDGTSYTLDQRLQAAFKAAETLPEGSTLKAQLQEWQGMYANQISNPYYHSGRTGDYFVNVGWKGMDDATWAKMEAALAGTNKVLGNYNGQDHAYFRVDSADQATGLRSKLERAMGNYADIEKSLHGKQSDSAMLNNPHSGISTALRSVISTLDDNIGGLGFSPEQAAKMREMMTRKILSMLPETSARLATIKRVGVPGYDGDFLGNFSRRALSASYDTANVYAMRAYSGALKGMDDSVRTLSATGDIKNQEFAQAVADEVKTRYNNSLQPVDNKTVNVINSFGYGFYLAMSPAYLIRNTLQPWHRGIPHLGSRFGFANSAKALVAASSDALKIIAASAKQGWKEGGVAGVLDTGIAFKNLGLPKDLEAFVTELHDLGRLDLGQAKQLQTMAMGGNTKMNDALRMVSLVSTYSEMFNRLSMGIAAFNLAKAGKSGLIGENNTAAHTKYAIEAIDSTLDNFDQNNTARVLSKHAPVTGKVTPLMTMFMQYNMQAMQQIARTVHDGMFSQDKTPAGLQRGAEARKEFLGLMGTTTMLAGAMGLPFANVFAGVYNMLTADDDAPSDIRQDARNYLAKTLGVTPGAVVAHGPLAALGVDTSTMGMQNILPGTDFLVSRRLLADRWRDVSENLMGPALNAGLDITQAMANFAEGKYVKGIEQALPSGLKGYWKAGQLATRGYTDARGNPIGVDATGWDIAQQAVGFRPGDRAETAEASYYMTANQTRINHRKQVITDRLYQAYRFGDEEAKAEALGELNAFNEKNPMQPIQGITSAFRQRAIREATGRTSGTGVGVSLRQLPIMQQQSGFVNHGGMVSP